jgi:hypothetical protein
MSLRLVAAALAFTTLTACAIPRTAIVTGAVTAVAGGMLLSDSQSSPQRDPYNTPAKLVDGAVSATQALLGTMVLLVGAGLITSGAVGLGMEREPALAPLAQVPAIDAPIRPTTLDPAGSATAVLSARAEQLASQISIESRAGHCGTATAAARRLAVLDRSRLIALIDRNPAISSCVAYRM